MEGDAPQDVAPVAAPAAMEMHLMQTLSIIQDGLRKLADEKAQFERVIREQKEELERERAEFERQMREERARFETEMEGERQRLQEEAQSVEAAVVPVNERIKLNVGGIIYHTSRRTVTKYPNTMLASMFSGRFNMECDADGCYFIDRNGEPFKYILAFLRSDSATVAVPPEMVPDVMAEAEYFLLFDLCRALGRNDGWSEHVDGPSKLSPDDFQRLNALRLRDDALTQQQDEIATQMTEVDVTLRVRAELQRRSEALGRREWQCAHAQRVLECKRAFASLSPGSLVILLQKRNGDRSLVLVDAEKAEPTHLPDVYGGFFAGFKAFAIHSGKIVAVNSSGRLSQFDIASHSVVESERPVAPVSAAHTASAPPLSGAQSHIAARALFRLNSSDTPTRSLSPSGSGTIAPLRNFESPAQQNIDMLDGSAEYVACHVVTVAGCLVLVANASSGSGVWRAWTIDAATLAKEPLPNPPPVGVLLSIAAAGQRLFVIAQDGQGHVLLSLDFNTMQWQRHIQTDSHFLVALAPANGRARSTRPGSAEDARTPSPPPAAVTSSPHVVIVHANQSLQRFDCETGELAQYLPESGMNIPLQRLRPLALGSRLLFHYLRTTNTCSVAEWDPVRNHLIDRFKLDGTVVSSLNWMS